MVCIRDKANKNMSIVFRSRKARSITSIRLRSEIRDKLGLNELKVISKYSKCRKYKTQKISHHDTSPKILYYAKKIAEQKTLYDISLFEGPISPVKYNK